MLYERVCIEAFGYEIPECVITSDEIEQRLATLYEKLKLPFGRLEMMTGIRERRVWPRGIKPSDASTMAGQKALKNANISGSDVECLINASVSRDFLEPATASLVHNNLKLSNSALVFDISNACLGFLNAIVMAANMIELGQIKTALIVAGESAGMLIEKTIQELNQLTNPTRDKIKDSFPSLTIGSGAVALVMTDISVSKTKHRLLGGVFKTATEYNHLCRGYVNSSDAGFADENNMPNMSTHAEKLLIAGCELARKTWDEFQKKLNWTPQTPKRIFCHQVGLMHKKAIYQSLDLDINKDFSTFETLGNVGSVSLPITFAIACDKGLVSVGDEIALLGIGSGINSIMLGVKW